MDIAEVEKVYVNRLIQLEDPGSQCDYLMMLGFEIPSEENLREDVNRIGGCKTAIWLKAGQKDGRVAFTGDSDSLLVRGILMILSEMYNGRMTDEVRGHPPGFLDYVSEEVIYPEIKHNGILKCYQRLAALSLN